MTIDQAMQLAIQHHQAGQLTEAEEIISRILSQAADPADALQQLGVLAGKAGCGEWALELFRRAIAIDPQRAKVHYRLGNVLNKLSRFDEAIAAYDEAIRLNPNYAETHNNRGAALGELGKLDEAIANYDEAIMLKNNYPEAHNNRGVALREIGRLDEAMAAYQQALQLKSDYAEARWNLGMLLLLQGDLRCGWPEYESRCNVKFYAIRRRSFSQPRWDGGDPRGQTIFLEAEQGLGDAIQFVRYAPLVAARGGRVIVECTRPLRRLFASMESIDQVICEDEPAPKFDLHCPLLSLPLAMKTDCVEAIPRMAPYLRPPVDCVEYWRDRLRGDGKQFKVGLVWAGNPHHKRDRQRSIPLQSLAPLAGVEKTTFYSLQLGPAAAQAHEPPAGIKLIDCSGDLHDMADTAGLIANLDLVISVDTAVAHLAGAMGKPVWTLLKFSPDWRWLMDREDSPWYPTMRLFRQKRIDDWSDVIASVAERLRAESERRS